MKKESTASNEQINDKKISEQIKIFASDDSGQLQKKANRFMKDKDIISVKFQTNVFRTGNETTREYSVMINYYDEV